MCFVWIWEQTAIISLYSINWLVAVTKAGSVWCNLYRTLCPQSAKTHQHMHITEILKVIILLCHMLVCFDYLVMECVYCEVRTETLYIIRINLSVWKFMWALWLTKWHWDRLSPVTTIPPMVLIYLHLHVSLNQKDKQAWWASKKECSFANRWALDSRILSIGV